jgi:hypothetical protein
VSQVEGRFHEAFLNAISIPLNIPRGSLVFVRFTISVLVGRHDDSFYITPM